MTSEELFNTTVTLMFGEAADRIDYQPYWTDYLNLMLAENFEINNALRISEEKEPLAEIPYIDDLQSEIGFEPIMERQILPYGLAGYLYMEDDPTIATAYKNKYEYERQRAGKAKYINSISSEDE